VDADFPVQVTGTYQIVTDYGPRLDRIALALERIADAAELFLALIGADPLERGEDEETEGGESDGSRR